jgi:sortase A
MKIRCWRIRAVFFVLLILSLQVSSAGLFPAPLPAIPKGAKRPIAESFVPMARITARRIGLDAPILEGTDQETLKKAVGHFPRTPLPGQPGNVALAAHRDTFFFPLRYIRIGDEITLTTPDGSYRYQVDSTRVVMPRNIEVLDPTNESILTLVTCYPFDLRGMNAPERFIVRARRISVRDSAPAGQK